MLETVNAMPAWMDSFRMETNNAPKLVLKTAAVAKIRTNVKFVILDSL